MSRSGSARLRNLLLLALVAVLLQSVLEMTRRPVRQRDYDLKLQGKLFVVTDELKAHKLIL